MSIVTGLVVSGRGILDIEYSPVLLEAAVHQKNPKTVPIMSPVTIEKDPANRFPTGSQQVPNRLRTDSVFFDIGIVKTFSCNFS